QTLRVLTRIEPKVFGPDGQGYGLNLTRASLDASCKYPWPAETSVDDPSGRHKFGFYAEDEPAFRWLREGAPDRRLGIDAQLADSMFKWVVVEFWHDGVIAAFDRLDSLDAWVETGDGSRRAQARSKNLTSQLIGRFAKAAVQAPRAADGEGELVRFGANIIVP